MIQVFFHLKTPGNNWQSGIVVITIIVFIFFLPTFPNALYILQNLGSSTGNTGIKIHLTFICPFICMRSIHSNHSLFVLLHARFHFPWWKFGNFIFLFSAIQLFSHSSIPSYQKLYLFLLFRNKYKNKQTKNTPPFCCRQTPKTTKCCVPLSSGVVFRGLTSTMSPFDFSCTCKPSKTVNAFPKHFVFWIGSQFVGHNFKKNKTCPLYFLGQASIFKKAAVYFRLKQSWVWKLQHAVLCKKTGRKHKGFLSKAQKCVVFSP